MNREDGVNASVGEGVDVAAIPRVGVRRCADIPGALDRLGLRGSPVLVLVGGAAGMTEAHLDALGSVLQQAALPLLDRLGATVVDGGTDSGVMRVAGRVRHAGGGEFPLVGVAAEGTVRVPGDVAARTDAAELEPHHTHFLLVPGTEWGDESAWLADVADALAGGAPSVTLVVNGGEITYADAAASLDRGRPVVVLAGTGRAADAVAGALARVDADPRAVAIASSHLTRVVAVDDADGLHRTLETALSR